MSTNQEAIVWSGKGAATGRRGGCAEAWAQCIFRTRVSKQNVDYKKNKEEMKRNREERKILGIGTIPVTVHGEGFNFLDPRVYSSICFPTQNLCPSLQRPFLHTF